ncbi:MAG: NYN domain-containing protein [Victivallales bacterium]|nr:NYN domain-containing protein [Victivallales bacterium]
MKSKNGAIRWLLKQLSFGEFEGVVNANSSLRHALKKAGIKVNSNNYRTEAIVVRMVSVIARNSEWVGSLVRAMHKNHPMAALCAQVIEILKPEWLRKNWRTIMRLGHNFRFWVIAFYCSQTLPWHQRAAKLMLNNNAFWQDGTVSEGSPITRASFEAAKKAPMQEDIILVDAFADFGFLSELEQGITTALQNSRGRNVNQRLIRQALISDFITPRKIDAEELVHITSTSKNRYRQILFHETAPSIPADMAEAFLAEAMKGLEEAAPEQKPAPESAPAEQSSDTAPETQQLTGLLPLTRDDSSSTRKQLGEARKECERLNKQVRILNNQMESLQREKDEAEAEYKRRLDEMGRELMAAIQALKAEKDAALEQEMRNFEAICLGVHPDTAAFLNNVRKDSRALEAKAEALLKRQAELDRKYDTRERLRGEKNRLEALLNRLRQANAEAMQLAPGLPAVQQEVEAKICEINGRLREECDDNVADMTSVANQLIAYAKEIRPDETAWRKFDEISSFLASPMGRSVVSPCDAELVNQQLKRCRERCQNAIQRALNLEPERHSPETAEKCREIAVISNFREEFQATEIFVDAYNVIKRDPVWSQMEKSVGGFQQARKEFIDRCSAISKMFRRVSLVFDSDAITTTVEHRDNLTIYYAAKTSSSQNADNFIVSQMQSLREKEKEKEIFNPRWLVTDDFELRLRVAECCEAVVLNATFTNLLRCCGR